MVFLILYLYNFRPNAVVADFGCGDAKIARSVENKVHSFDLVALNKHVKACDMSHVSSWILGDFFSVIVCLYKAIILLYTNLKIEGNVHYIFANLHLQQLWN